MAGAIIELLKPTSFDFGGLVSLGVAEFVIRRNVPLQGAREATAILRFHTTPTWGGGLSITPAEIRLSIWAASECPDDPSALFTTSLMDVSVSSLDQITAPYMKTATVTAGLTDAVAASLRFAQAQTFLSAGLAATLSADLALKW